MAEEQGRQPGIPALATSVKFALATAQIIKEEWDNGIKAAFFCSFTRIAILNSSLNC